MDNQQPQLKPEEKLNIMAENAKTEAGVNGFMNPGQKRRGRPKGSKKVGPGEAGPTISHPGPGGPNPDPTAKWVPWATMYTEMLSSICVQAAEDERAKIVEPNKSLLIASGAQVGVDFLGDVGSKWMNLTAFLGVSALAGFTAYRLRRENLEKLRAEFRAKQAPMNNGQSSMEGFSAS